MKSDFIVKSKLQVSFAEYRLFCRALLQKRLQFDRSSNQSHPILNLVEYGMALVSRIDKITGLFCKRDIYERRYSAKETYNFVDPTDRSHPIIQRVQCCVALCCATTFKLVVSFAE